MKPSRWRVVGIAVLVGAAGQALRPIVSPWLTSSNAPTVQMFSLLAVFIAAWAAGFWSGVLAALLSVLGAYVSTSVRSGLAPSLHPIDVTRIALFLLISLVFCVVTESHLRAKRRLIEQRDALEDERAKSAAAHWKVHEERARLRLVADHIPTMLANADREWRFKFVNRAYANRWNKHPRDFIGRPLVDVLGPAALETVRPSIERALAGETVEAETAVQIPGRPPEFIRTSHVPERDEAGNVVGWIAAITDLTDRRRAETDLKRFASLVENASDFIGICDLEFRPVYLNPAGMALVGLADTAPADRPGALDYLFPEDVTWMTGEFSPRVMREGHAVTELRFRHFTTGE